jgi:hypothetical protein
VDVNAPPQGDGATALQVGGSPVGPGRRPSCWSAPAPTSIVPTSSGRRRWLASLNGDAAIAGKLLDAGADPAADSPRVTP